MTKQDLKDYRSILCEIAELERLAKAQEEKQAASVSPFASLVCERRIASYRRDLDELTAARERIERAVNALPSLERRVIRLKYFEGLSWSDVAVRTCYSEDYVRKSLCVSAFKKMF